MYMQEQELFLAIELKLSAINLQIFLVYDESLLKFNTTRRQLLQKGHEKSFNNLLFLD